MVITQVLLAEIERAFAVTGDEPICGVTREVSYIVPVPEPVSPIQFEPQQPTTSSVLMTHVCPYPPATALTVETMVTAVGPADENEPFPNWPELPSPQHDIVSSARMAHACMFPREIDLAPEIPLTTRGYVEVE